MCAAASCAVRSIVQQCALRSTQRDESRKKTPYMCHATIKRAAKKKCIANIVQRSVLAAVRPSQVKPSAAESGGTAQRRAQRQAGVLRSVQRSTASAATTRNASEGVRDSASLRTALQPTLRAALHSARHCTAPPALHSAQHYTAPNTASQDKVDRSKRSKPVAQWGCAR